MRTVPSTGARQLASLVLASLVTACVVISHADAQTSVSRKPSSRSDESESRSPALRKVRSTTNSGPLTIGGKTVSVVFRHEKLVDSPHPEFAETVESLEVRDAAGKTHFREAMAPVVRARVYMPAVLVDVEVVESVTGEGIGLVLSYGYRPSGLGIAECRLLAFKGGVLTPLPGPLLYKTGLGRWCGLREEGATGRRRLWPGETNAAAAAAAPIADGLLKLRVYNDYYAAIVPVVVDLVGWTLRPVHATGTFEIEPMQRYLDGEVHAVRLFPDRALTGRPVPVEVTARTKVEFIDVYATLDWDERPDGIRVQVSDSAALRVKINGREGWVSGYKDLYALGLPERMPPPR